MRNCSNSFILVFAVLCFSFRPVSPKWIAVSKEDMANVFEQMSVQLQNTNSYSLTVTHTSYENYITTIPVEKSRGYFKKYKKDYHSFLLGIHTIQNEHYKMVMDTARKFITVANPDNFIYTTYTPDDYTTILSLCTSIKAIDQGTGKHYRLEFGENYKLAYFDMTVNAKGMLQEMVWYYSQEIKKSETEKVKPRLSIIFSDYDTKPAYHYHNEFDESRYFVQQGKKLVLTGPYKDFTLNDQRLIKK